MTRPERPLLFVTSGEPAGIGPDICLDLLRAPPDADLVVCADRAMLARRGEDLGLPADYPAHVPAQRQPVSVLDCPLQVPAVAGQPDLRNAAAVVAMLRETANRVAQGQGDALVTAPVAKAVLAGAAPGFRGHTEFLADLAGVPTPVMALVGARLRVALVTTHLPLAAVPAAITAERVSAVLRVADAGMRHLLAGKQPHWLVCGLNPHAGEGGLFGTEERDAILPALEQARHAGIDVEGPVPADTAFLSTRLGARDCVLAMYHDQGLPVAKRDDFAGTVNVTLGLPYVRTSVDHGTAMELAGTGRADPSSLRAAATLASRLAVARQRRMA